MLIGSHVSMTGGLLGAAQEAASYGANTFMLYTGAPQNTRRQPVERLQIDEGKEFMAQNGISDIVVHAPYIINLASCKEETFSLAKSFLRTELERTDAFGSRYLVLHPGSFVGADLDYGIKRVIEGIRAALDDETNALLCLETMAGKGSEIGRDFTELARIIDGTGSPLRDRLRVCFDTCHTHDSGYDIVNDLDGVMKQFNEILGLDLLAVFHINGSLNPRGARKDRHANIGAGEDNPKGADHIGFEALHRLAHSKYAQGRPLILETPWLDDRTNLYKEEIAMLRGTI